MRLITLKFFTLLLLLFATMCYAQQLPLRVWLQKFNDNSQDQAMQRYSVFYSLDKMDTAANIQAAYNIEKATATGNKRLQLIGKSAKAKLLFYYLRNKQAQHAELMKECLNEAIQRDDLWLQAEFGRWYSEMLNTLNQKELAVQYAITALKLKEDLGHDHFPVIGVFYMWVGETLLQQNYEAESVKYLKKGLELAEGDTLVKPFRFMFTYNNLGLAHRKLKQFEAAIRYFDLLQNYCVKINRPDWVAIAYKNRLPCYVALGHTDSATAIANRLLELASNNQSEPEDEMVAYEMLGKIALQQKEYTRAIEYLKRSKMLNNGRYPSIQNRVHEAIAACYEAMGQPSNAYPYLKLASAFNDSVSTVKVNYRKNYLFIKADYEKKQLKLRQLAAEARQAVLIRNISIIALLLVSGMAIVWLNRRRHQAQQGQKLAAKELNTFKEEIIHKNNRIETLQESIRLQQNKLTDSNTIEELSKQIILTEDDWQNFKQLFEKTYPAFFKTIREKTPGITEAEQRMAALLKLQLNTKQIAAMQGISPDSVHKTRHRLRQRFGTGTTAELESIIAAM
jgi:tetratricopeptide (TPR) repeat protein